MRCFPFIRYTTYVSNVENKMLVSYTVGSWMFLCVYTQPQVLQAVYNGADSELHL